jgi:hypothetical protein
MEFVCAFLTVDNERGMVHVRNDAKRFAAGGLVLIAGVEVAEFVEAGGDVREIGEASEQAITDMRFVARRGGTRGDGHQLLIKFFGENVAGRNFLILGRGFLHDASKLRNVNDFALANLQEWLFTKKMNHAGSGGRLSRPFSFEQ